MFDFSRQLTFDEISTLYSTPIKVNPTKDSNNLFSTNSFIYDSNSTTDCCSSPEQANTSMTIDFDENAEPFGEAQMCIEKEARSNQLTSSYLKSKEKRKAHVDRFIPNRKTSKLSMAFTPLHEYNNSVGGIRKAEASRREDPNFGFDCLYKNLVLNYDPVSIHSSKTQVYSNTNIFRYANTDENQVTSNNNQSSFGMDCEKILSGYQTNNRKIASTPYKVLDAPGIQDDFYLNLVDWSSQNVLGVGLSSCVYLWSAMTSKVSKLCDLGTNDSVASIGWDPKGIHLSVGTNSGQVQIWDVTKMKKVRVLTGHAARVGALAWSSSLLASGSRDKNIHTRDLRCSNNYVSTLTGHRQEVCGLKWSFDEQQLASGGNDNKLFVWSPSSTTPSLRFSNHTAAVKALAWSPHQHGLLASGGGTADRTIRFWNTLSNRQIDCIDTGSQVCNLVFSKTSQELVSTHGYSQNQIVVWKYPNMEKVTTLTGHSYRVLYLAMDPSGENIVTGAGDETLRFWNVFSSAKKNETNSNINNKLKPSGFDLR